MRQTKTTIKCFNILQYKKEEEYLSNMHRKGWKLTGVTFPCFYHFEKCEPENVTYCLDFNREGIAHKSEYVQMFEDCNWEYLFDFVGYSYFRKASDASNINDDIFCDDESRLDMMKRVFKGRVFPLVILFLCIILSQLYINMVGYGTGSHYIQRDLAYLFLAMGIGYVIMFGIFTYQFYRFEKSVRTDRNVRTKYIGIGVALVAMLGLMIGITWLANKSCYEITDKENGFVIEAELLNKTVIKEYELKSGDTVCVNHKGESGELYISICKDGEEPAFYGNTFSGFGYFEVNITDSGDYQIKCVGRRECGNIEIEIK